MIGNAKISMITTDDNAILVDTNVLLTATTITRPLHEEALVVLNDWPNLGVMLCTNGQVLREYLVVATRPEKVNGLGLSLADAIHNIITINQRMHFLSEDHSVSEHLRKLIVTQGCSGKQIHDANLVATAITHRVTKLVTANIGDFDRFKDKLKVLNLLNAKSESLIH